MADTKSTTTSYGRRVGSSLKGIIIGLVLFLGATTGLFWNEGRCITAMETAETNQSLHEPVAAGTIPAVHQPTDAALNETRFNFWDAPTWAVRGAGALLAIAGLRVLLGILKAWPSMTNIAATRVSIVVGLAWSLLAISVSWLFYRPHIGIPLAVLAALGFVYLKIAAWRKKKAARAAGKTANTP